MSFINRLFGTEKETPADTLPLTLHNTLSDKDEVFQPAFGKTVKMYNCGPTVYGPQHIGNLSMFVFVDVLRRTLEYNDYLVRQVINFTDVGHLSGDNEGDADEGVDRMTKGLKREKLALTLENMKKMGEKYANAFLDDLRALNIETGGTTFPYASDYIAAQIAMVKTLEEKAYAYRGEKGVYFDTARFPSYGALGAINLEGLKEGARVEAESEKRNPTDFLLWKFDKKLGWDSPWGKGFPGWHIECSAMSHSILGDQLDIHTGGIEHIPVHHNNEIAQSEAALGKKPFARFWLHRAHLQLEGGKIAKSKGTAVYLSDIIERGFHPLSFRYLLLGAHYRTSSNFTWEALQAAETALVRLVHAANESQSIGTVSESYQKSFHGHVNRDLDTPGALAVVSQIAKDDTLSAEDRRAALADFDRVLGLQLTAPDERMQALLAREYGHVVATDELPEDIRTLIEKRAAAREAKQWDEADAIRKELETKGYEVADTAEGQKILQRAHNTRE